MRLFASFVLALTLGASAAFAAPAAPERRTSETGMTFRADGIKARTAPALRTDVAIDTIRHHLGLAVAA